MRDRYKRIHRSGHGSLTELNITPLLDLVFVLLVIFIITTPQLTNSLEINLPSGKPPPPKPSEPRPSVHRIAIDPQGQVFLDKKPLSDQALRSALQQLKKDRSDLAVVVESSEETEYQHVIIVFDLLQQLEKIEYID